jgi:RecB family exonuclease
VVDLKTSSTKPSKDELARHPQLAVYQLAVVLGAFADQQLDRPGGASLLQLKKGVKADEQFQGALEDDGEPTWAHELVTQVVDGMSGSAFPAAVNKHCQNCKVRTSCPAWPEGQGVLR